MCTVGTVTLYSRCILRVQLLCILDMYLLYSDYVFYMCTADPVTMNCSFVLCTFGTVTMYFS